MVRAMVAAGLRPVYRWALRGLLAPDWYRERYPDVAAAGVDPVEHYLRHGMAEGREISPDFSVSGYARYHGRPNWKGARAALHYRLLGRRRGANRLPAWEGGQVRRPGPTLLVCGHLAGPCLFGAERSLLDVLWALDRLGFNLVATLPSADNAGYLEQVRQYCAVVHVLPYAWWHARRQHCSATQQNFEGLIQRYDVAAVYLNTLVLEEPARAARAQQIPVLTHVREIPGDDPALCEALGATAEVVTARAVAQADRLIANSHCVAKALRSAIGPVARHHGVAAAPDVVVVPNGIDVARWQCVPVPSPTRGRLRIGMVSSNLAKKGLADFAQLARRLAVIAPAVECLLFGPRTAEVDALEQRVAEGALPVSLRYCGYREDPRQALAVLDVVVNLSRFQESFGRSVLEALAGGRPVVCYSRGALPELVKDQVTGFTVPFGDVNAVAEHIAGFAASPERISEMGGVAKVDIASRFDTSVFMEKLAVAFEGLVDTPGFGRK